MRSYISTLKILVGFLQVSSVELITSNDPCDPLTHNVTLRQICHNLYGFELFSSLMDYPKWTETGLNVVRCDFRGITEFPLSVSKDVQILDLTGNFIHHYRKQDLKGYEKLEALLLVANCLRVIRLGLPYCNSIVVIERDAFRALINLKYLDLRGNFLKIFPSRLPPSLNVLYLSFSGIERFNETDFVSLKNLSFVFMKNLCLGNPPIFQIFPSIAAKCFHAQNNLIGLDLSQNYFRKIF
ncbi:unnamed protein product [Clavelina lepadiformis]|uniref:Toll-like receptor 5 n=1 Tax=Clavelina lepadiformis TaxID=159417 RepID=A0ABP0GW82_CLALP